MKERAEYDKDGSIYVVDHRDHYRDHDPDPDAALKTAVKTIADLK